MSRFFLFILIALTLLFSSEVIYMVANKSPELNYFLLERAKHYAVSGNFNQSFKYLAWAGRLTAVNLEPPPADSGFQKGYLNYLANINPQTIIRSPDHRTSEVFYNLGIIAYKNNLNSLTRSLFQVAVNIQPELSFYHVELANYYLSVGNKGSANEVILNCLKLKDPRTHCQEYQEKTISEEKPEQMGFLNETIEKYYNDK